ncbi:MAG: class I adenylate-forming enzyme family protein, partial [Halobacteria archaeon]|nr:class I adenylate-forming enzyme family protein [Halobacteria archaeon]
RFVLLGGAPASEELIERCQERDIPVCPTYGMTETTSQVATALPHEAFSRKGTVGNPLMFTDVNIVDSEGNPVERGENGEIVVSGPTVTKGYYGDPEGTEEAFGPLGFHTGDVGYRDNDGYLWILNRLDDVIITGGEKVNPGEVTDVLLRHESVVDAAVVGVEDDEWGERVSALVVLRGKYDGADETLEGIRRYCKRNLAGYKCPKQITRVDKLPRTDSGTVDRERAREILRERN